MDSFERAHVIRIPNTKPKKEQVTKKKKVKMMLLGYKTSDNDLIKEADNVGEHLDDSSSISGFSDLILTSSSNDEISKDKYGSPVYNDSQNDSNINDSAAFNAFEFSQSSRNCTSDDNLQIDFTTDSFDYTEFEQDQSGSITDVSTDAFSYEETNASNSSLTTSSISEFDPKGELASQIYEKLKSKNLLEPDKRKIVDYEPAPVKEKNYKRQKKAKSQRAEDLEMSDESVSSAPFVTVTATDIEEQTFNDVLGQYKYSTVRNLPPDNQSMILTTDSNRFIEKCISGDVNISNTDEVSSLIPEVDNDLSVSDLVEIDTSIPTVDEITTLNESQTDVIESELPLDINNDTQISEENYTNKLKVYFGINNCIIIFKHPTQLFLHGKVIVKSLRGNIEMFGYTLTENEFPILAPLNAYAQCLTTVESNNDDINLFRKLTAVGISTHDAEDIVTNLCENDGILLLKPMNCPKMDFIDQNFRYMNLFKSTYREKGLGKASNLLGCTLYGSQPEKFFEANPLWQRAISYYHSTVRGIVCGGKGSGKSTFVRYYANKLIKKGPVLVIDLDPGQSEFTVAGNVSATVINKPIFGPSFTHLKKPNMCLNIGIISTMDNIQRYVNAVKTIISYSSENFSKMPWIVNTMGMTNAVGLKFITLIIALATPDFVLQYDSRNAKKSFDDRLTAANVTDLLRKFKYDRIFSNVTSSVPEYSLILAPEVEILTSNKSSLIPRDERYLNFLAYFAELIRDVKDLNTWLLGVTPYEVHLKDLYIASNVKLTEESVKKVINGKVVALCQLTTEQQPRVFTLDHNPLLCHGHGLIRGIDWDKDVLYVATPLAGDELAMVNTIVYADWVPEFRGQELHLPNGKVVPYRIPAQHHQKNLMVPPKRRFNPLQLLKMTRNS